MRGLLRLFVVTLVIYYICIPRLASAQGGHPALGVMLHFLPPRGGLTQITDLDVRGLAMQLKQMRVDYFVLTLGQNSGQYIAPNPVLTGICPQSLGWASTRDIPSEFVQALRGSGIKLMLYLPFRSPQGASDMMKCLGDVHERSETPEGFVQNWSQVIGYWSSRYGSDLYGWWFDGAYNVNGMTPSGWAELCDAAGRAGSGRLLAFNAGEGPSNFNRNVAPCQNWMAGELNRFAGVAITPSSMRAHVLTPLANRWGANSPPQYTSTEVDKLLAAVRLRDGMVTFDLGLGDDGLFREDGVDLVRAAADRRSRQ